MTMRNDWEFTYTAIKLAEAANLKRNTHAEKLTYWAIKKKETMDRVRADGIEVQDSVASDYSNTKGVFGPQIRIDPGLQRDLTECQAKILEHNALVENYDGWVQVLRGNPEARLALHHDDWLFFFGK